MFDFVRTHQRLMQFILLLFIFPSFALVGVSSYLQSGREDVVASVGSEKITQFEFDDAMRKQMDQMRQRYGAQFDEALFNTREQKTSVLNNLIAQYALREEVKNERLTIPDSILQQTILSIPGLTRPDGSFNKEEYIRILASQGMTPALYESKLRQDLEQQQLVSAIQTSSFVPKAVIAQVSGIINQEREVQSLHFKAADFINQVTISDAMLKAWYDKNSALFAIPESAKIEYVVLSEEGIASQMTATDEEIKSYYEQNIKNYTVAEQRRASHILIKVNKGSSQEEKAKDRAKAEEVLALVKKQPTNFAQLAKQYSQDEGSAAKGGDLDYFGKGMMVKPFEDAAFQLKSGQLSDLVESDFGYHIIHLVDVKPASVKVLAEVKEQISAELKKQKASKKFSELAEIFTNTVYEQSDSLKPVSDKLKLTIESADKVARTSPSVDNGLVGKHFLSNPKLLKALFSDDVIKNKHNTEAVEVAPNTLVSAHVIDYKPASQHAFDEVKSMVTQQVKSQEAEVLAKKAGEAKLSSLKATPDMVGFGENKSISRNQPADIPPTAMKAIMQADGSKLPSFVGVVQPGQGYTVYRINKVQQPAANEVNSAQLKQQVEQVYASKDFVDYIAMLKQKEKVKIVKPISGGNVS